MSAVRLTRSKLKGAPENRNVTSFQDVLDAHRLEFTAAMDDDFNAPIALATLQNLTTEVNKLLNGPDQVSRATLEAIEQTYTDLGGKVLGIVPASEAASLDVQREDKLIELLIALRKQARDEKQYAKSDQIRDQLKAIGVSLEDRSDGTVYRID